MIDDLKLPADTPLKEKPKLLPADIYLEWVIENVRHLHETGRLECVPIRHAVRSKYRSSFSAAATNDSPLNACIALNGIDAVNKAH